MLLVFLIVIIQMATPLGSVMLTQEFKYSHIQKIMPSAVMLSYTDSSGNDVPLGIGISDPNLQPSATYYYGDWNDPYTTYVIWGYETSSGTWNGNPYEVYNEENYGFWLNRVQVKYLFTDIPSGYDAYFVCLHYVDRTNDEYLVVTWDGEVIDGTWYPMKNWPSADYEIDYQCQAFVVYQDYSSYHQMSDWYGNGLTMTVPMVYACDY